MMVKKPLGVSYARLHLHSDVLCDFKIVEAFVLAVPIILIQLLNVGGSNPCSHHDYTFQ